MKARSYRIGKGMALASLFVAGALLRLVGTAHADAAYYSTQRRQIRACVLVTDTITGINNTAHNPAPNLFFVLERRQNVKPSGWEFLNPLAPSVITADMFNRWQRRGTNDPAFVNGTPQSTLFQVGAPLTKNIAAYWEINLDRIAVEQLQQFDIVYVGLRGVTARYTPEQRAKLRKYVDGGGTIWLENLGGAATDAAAPFVVDMEFNGNYPANSRPYLDPTQRQNSLARFPYSISPFEMLGLGAAGAANRQPHRNPGGGLLSPSVMTPVVLTRDNGNTILPFISAGEYGSGRLIVSSAGLADGIGAFAGGANVEGPNSGVISGDRLFAARPVDLKFAYNIIAWTSTTTTSGVNARRTGGSDERLGSGLTRNWATVPIAPDGVGSGAVLYKGVVFYVDGNNILHAFDANPKTDLDGNNNSDDGLQDFRAGTPYDELWRSGAIAASSVRVSTPTLFSVFDTTLGGTRDLLAVSTSEGRTLVFDALPRTNGVLNAGPNLVWSNVANIGNLAASLSLANFMSGNLGLPAPAPVFNEGFLFTLANSGDTPDNNWRIVALRPNGTNAFGQAGVTAPYNGSLNGTAIEGMPDPVGSLASGYIRDESTGALDLMVYTPTRPFLNTPNGVIQGVWFRTRNEPLQAVPGDNTNTQFKPSGERARVPWFVPAAGVADDLRPVITIVTRDSTGIITATQRFILDPSQAAFTGAAGQREMRLTMPRAILPNETVNADYVLNWSALTIGSSTAITPDEVRRFANRRQFRLVSSGNTPPPVFMTGSVALSGQDLLLFNGVYDNPQLPGRLYGLREQYTAATAATNNQRSRRRGNGTEVAWMWSPHAGGNFSLANYAPRLINRDPFAPQGQTGQPVGQLISQFRAIGSPVVSNGIVYTVGTALLPNLGNATVILALQADPTMTFSVGAPIPNNAIQIRVRQVDMVNTTQGLGPERFITLTENNNFFVDRPSGTITITNCREGNGEVINTALPVRVQITVPGSSTPDEIEVRNPITGNSPLDNLVWYMVIPQTIDTSLANILPASGLTATADSLYFGTTDGQIVTVNIKGAPSGGSQFLIYDKERVRIAKLPTFIDPTTNQPLTGNPIIHPPLGFGSTLAVGTPRGVATLENLITLIADRTRLLQVDSGGNAVWTLDSTRSISTAGGSFFDGAGQPAVSRVTFASPAVAHITELDQQVIADTGNHRVVQADRSGTLSWEIRSLNNGMQLLRPGDPMSLNTPSDVQTFTNSGTSLQFAHPTLRTTNGNAPLTFSYNGAYFAVHYLIADSGNFRVVEVVDAYDQNGVPIVLQSNDPNYANVPMSKLLVFVTRNTAEQSRSFRYRTVQQVMQANGNPQDNFLLATVDNVRVPALDPASNAVGAGATSDTAPGGSLVALRRYPGPGATFRDGDLAWAGGSIRIQNPITSEDRVQDVTNPAWFRLVYIANQPRYLLADANGVYLLRFQGTELVTDWYLSSDDYLFLTGRRLQASCLQLLPQSDYLAGQNRFVPRFLIVNRYSGEDNVPDVFGFPGTPRGELNGEVVEIRSSDFYLTGYRVAGARLYRPAGRFVERNPNGAIQWMIPNETIPMGRLFANSPLIPLPGKIKRSIGSADTGTFTFSLEQPVFAERQN